MTKLFVFYIIFLFSLNVYAQPYAETSPYSNKFLLDYFKEKFPIKDSDSYCCLLINTPLHIPYAIVLSLGAKDNAKISIIKFNRIILFRTFCEPINIIMDSESDNERTFRILNSNNNYDNSSTTVSCTKEMFLSLVEQLNEILSKRKSKENSFEDINDSPSVILISNVVKKSICVDGHVFERVDIPSRGDTQTKDPLGIFICRIIEYVNAASNLEVGDSTNTSTKISEVSSGGNKSIDNHIDFLKKK